MADRFAPPVNATTHVGGWKALSASVDSLLQRRPLIADFDDVNTVKPRLVECIDCGVSAVPIYKLMPSPLRYAAFEQCLPEQSVAIDYATPDRMRLPIELYKVGDSYFVRDGHVRVAQARLRDQLFLRARVIECRIGSTTCASGVMRRLLVQERAAFFTQYPFPVGHAAHTFESRTLGNWLHLALHLESVGAAQRSAGAETTPLALARWYDDWYRPVARAIQRCHLLADFPAFRELDLYLWAVERHGPWTGDQSFPQRLRLARRNVVALWGAQQRQSAST